jgi:transketolase
VNEISFNQKDLKSHAANIRRSILRIAEQSSGPSHIGGSFSIVEILTYLYGHYLNIKIDDPRWMQRDRFILSKGHAALGFYVALTEFGIMPESVLESYKKDESKIIAHPIQDLDFGIESSNGSLGHGLAFGVGLAWATRAKNQENRIVVLLGDGECNEGSVWEAAMSAAHLQLTNITAIVDANGLQSDGTTESVMKINQIENVWKSFGWEALKINGHDFTEIDKAFKTSQTISAPVVIIAETTKGKGVSFMENNNEWHHGRITQTLLEQAVSEIGSNTDDNRWSV